jgi:hypothetical protein
VYYITRKCIIVNFLENFSNRNPLHRHIRYFQRNYTILWRKSLVKNRFPLGQENAQGKTGVYESGKSNLKKKKKLR